VALISTSIPGRAGSERFHPASLDALNFLLADVRGALGPYLNVFLVTQQHWTVAAVGIVTATGGWLGLAMQTPVGAAIDATRAKRGVILAALSVLAVGATLVFLAPSFWPVIAANALMAVAGDFFGPAVAALNLGLYRRAELARRMGRNAAFDHAGNIAIAAVAGVVGWAFSQRAVFLLVPGFALLAALAVWSIPLGAIDHRQARGGEPRYPSGAVPVASALHQDCRLSSDLGRCSFMPAARSCSTSPTRRCCRSSGRNWRWPIRPWRR
jgi:hypothetical protein